MRIIFVRHGEPDYPTDSLVPRGVLQAESVARRLAKVGVDRIFSSPMGRARQTAEPLCRLLGMDCRVEEWTREISMVTEYPDGEKKSIALMKNTYARENGGWDLSPSHALDGPIFEGTDVAEKLAFVEKEGNAFLEKLGYQEEDGNYRILWPNEEKVVLFCHGNFSKVWLSCLLKVPFHIMNGSFGISHTGVTILHFKNHEDGTTAPRCLCFDDLSHLYAHGPDMRYNGKFEI